MSDWWIQNQPVMTSQRRACCCQRAWPAEIYSGACGVLWHVIYMIALWHSSQSHNSYQKNSHKTPRCLKCFKKSSFFFEDSAGEICRSSPLNNGWPDVSPDLFAADALRQPPAVSLVHSHKDRPLQCPAGILGISSLAGFKRAKHCRPTIPEIMWWC